MTKGKTHMDPNVNLKEQLELAKEAIECGGFAHPEDAVRLAALVIAFDEWMRKGGFLPDTWTLSANETRRERLKIWQRSLQKTKLKYPPTSVAEEDWTMTKQPVSKKMFACGSFGI